MHVKIYFTAWHCGARDVGVVVCGDTKLIINIKKIYILHNKGAFDW